jgi:Tol biopolymer transport system component
MLNAGTRLGPYEITMAIGAGGMGEVYRARDTRLDRVVAIKVLSAHLADHHELRERFEREARTIASLNHPHICTLHDIGRQDGIDFLVMEYLDGETLAQRLLKGPLPLDQVLRYSIEIADSLNKAHRKGVTHRDLKPGNIMIEKSGIKLLDFGLAKLKQEAAPAIAFSVIPTMGDPPTAQGTLLGTPQYMAPEQVEGRNDAIDARTDIFAFGAVVYEMATGKKAFEGKSQASIMAAILEREPPPMSALQPMTPRALDRVVRKCLAKEPEERWQAASDVCDELKWIAEGGSQVGVQAPALPQRNMRRWIGWASVAAAAVLLAVIAAVPYFRRAPADVAAVRFSVSPPEKGIFSTAAAFLTVSPDGRKLVFIAAVPPGRAQLWIRPLDSPTAQPLPGTEQPYQPFWSPDSRYVGFFAEAKLKKIGVSGGPAQTVADSMFSAAATFGGTWSPDGVILFAATGAGTAGAITGGAIYRVSAAGGTPTRVTAPDPTRQERAHGWPFFLPDGRHFLYFAAGTTSEGNAIKVGSLDSPERTLLLNATSNPVYAPPGYLLFDRQGTVMAQPFDAGRIRLTGEAVPIAEGVQYSPNNGKTAFDASENGVLAYRGGAASTPLKLVWVDRKGAEQPVPAAPHEYYAPRISPDGQRVAIAVGVIPDTQIWLYDLGRETLTRLTFEGAANIGPLWTPDGKRIAYKGTANRLFWQPADGSGSAEPMTSSELSQNNVPGSWTPDGQSLAFTQDAATRKIWILPLKDGKPQPFGQGTSYETAPRFSPDGRWIAYDSRESGRDEIYVRPYPGPGGKWQISTEGGTEVVWNRNGREIFYRNGNKMIAVDITSEPTFSAGKPRQLFEGSYIPTPLSFPDYDVSPDGQRFLMLKAAEQTAAPAQINVVLNWFEDLKRRAPSGK